MSSFVPPPRNKFEAPALTPRQSERLGEARDRSAELEDASHAPPAWLWWGGLALMLAGLTAPILAVDVPPLADYPNHLARCFFLAFGDQDPVLQGMFSVRWELIPNLAIDLMLPPLMHVMPPLLAGKLVVALAMLLPVTGSVALSRACCGRLSLWPLGVAFVAYNSMFLIGLLNFQLGIGVALWGAAAWIALSSRRPILATLIGAAFALAAFICHLFGFFFFALLIGCAEMAAILRRGVREGAARRFALSRIGAATAAVAIPAILSILSPVAQAGGPTVRLSLGPKLYLLLGPTLGYSCWIVQAVAMGAFAILLVWWRARGRLFVAPLAGICTPLLLLAFVALPVGAKGAYWIDARIPVLFGFAFFSTTMPHRLGRGEAVAITIVLLALFVGRMAYITEVWAGSRQDVEDVRQALAPVTPGSRVLMVYANPYLHRENETALPISRIPIAGLPAANWHYAAFALIDRRAFWSDAFALPGQQPVATRPAYQASGDGGKSQPIDYHLLAAYADSGATPAPTPYLAGWPDKFDYVLLLNAEIASDPETLLPRRLELLERQGSADLFRVKH